MIKTKSKTIINLYLQFIDQKMLGKDNIKIIRKIYEIYGKNKGAKIIKYWNQLPVSIYNNFHLT